MIQPPVKSPKANLMLETGQIMQSYPAAASQALSIADQLIALKSQKISAIDSITAFISHMERHRGLNIFITENKEGALRQAVEADKRLASGMARALEGIPIAVKDNFCTKGLRTTAGSKMLTGMGGDEAFVPTYESTVTQKLLDAGAIILGKTNMDEFAMGSSTETSYFGPTINPVGVRIGLTNLVAGGSSGGSAAAVAAGVALGAIGTDTGGSVRQPASYCGVVGMKPSYGACSRWGIIAYGSSLDQAGAFGKCVRDVAILLDVIVGEDERDTTSIPGLKFGFEQALARPASKLRIGFPRELSGADGTQETEQVWAAARTISASLGADILEVSVPTIKYALPAYYIIALSEASSNLARYDGVRYGHRARGVTNIADMYERTRAEGFGAEAKRRILAGTYSLSAGYYDAYYLRALKVRRVIAQEFASAFGSVDVILMPTAPTAAFEIGSHQDDPVKMYLEDVFTVPVNLAGLPAISLPIGQDRRGMPLGLQIVGPQLGDEIVIRAGSAIELASAELGLP